MSKLRDFAAGRPVEFTDAEIASLCDAGLMFTLHYLPRRPMLTEAGWAVCEGEGPQKGRGAR